MAHPPPSPLPYTHWYTPAYAHRVALSHINILAWRCFIYWVAFALGWRSSFPLWLLGMPACLTAAWLLPAWLLRRVWQLARSWGHDGCDVQQDAGHGEGEGESSYARPRDVYAIWVISAPRGSRNRPVAASLATRQHEIMLILTIKFEQPQLTSPLPSSSQPP